MNTDTKILIADDNQEIREIVRVLLESERYQVIEAVDGDDAVSKVDENVDLIILDIMMPGKSGFKACIEIREKTSAPILFLTARTDDSDKFMAFSAGSDDYLSKPFSYTELVSRVKALLRRYYVYKGKDKLVQPDIIIINELQLNTMTNEVSVGGKEISLTEIEYKILLLMAKYRKKIFSAQNLYESVWEEPYYHSCNNTVMVHIRNLRMKLEHNPQYPEYIKTVWGKGYRIE
ncbi:DNA-binding response regulator, OmpR family, contains REC and winged-helix (wHTH) domain [Paenibacillus sp. UNCCL117]|uniref:response regulator transcription factor n=1 Tax=unclassified Paenibacillus TaxID=185978 RepID=UPI000881040E|nr:MULTISPECIES: response regulator transcription factor [unclassified Paenibacillus]SDD32794.1 DNA-binding response regulator, OmpR family, contains REC and winged-helix (wHTH) domain [Paenibacillus sp. cl123]SFW39733.1 DNA-binding response regulator, OmpR family, contains REC and winged-helix (wHTH) domain [Paenibacillus sp. UNCCL117]